MISNLIFWAAMYYFIGRPAYYFALVLRFEFSVTRPLRAIWRQSMLSREDRIAWLYAIALPKINVAHEELLDAINESDDDFAVRSAEIKFGAWVSSVPRFETFELMELNEHFEHELQGSKMKNIKATSAELATVRAFYELSFSERHRLAFEAKKALGTADAA